MKEDFLHYLWRFGQFDARNLRTQSGEPLTIVHPGQYNGHSGPDFDNARLRLGDTLWAGSVEMHLRSSDWYRHGHQHDTAYENVLLHVVFEHDTAVRRADGSEIPVLELRTRIPAGLHDRYWALLHTSSAFPCQPHLSTVPAHIWTPWLDRMLAERLAHKTEQVKAWLKQTGNDWEEAFFRALARAFGLRINADPFERVARELPFRLLSRYRDSLFRLEALLFGFAGFLEDAPFQDEYPNALYREWRHLRLKHGLRPMNASVWKFLRLRPNNFPTLRMAQFAAYLWGREQLWEPVLQHDPLDKATFLSGAQPSDYWQTHYRFDHESPRFDPNPGDGLDALLTINAVVPFLYWYGRTRDEPTVCHRAQLLLERLPAEKSAALRPWQSSGKMPAQAADSQALLHLGNQYCAHKKCLQCSIGVFLMKM